MKQTYAAESAFKHFTVKGLFKRNPYRLRMDKEVQFHPKPPMPDGNLTLKEFLDTEELAWRAAVYTSIADSMLDTVISELSPKDSRTKHLKEQLAIVQEAQVGALNAAYGTASNLQLVRRDAALKPMHFSAEVVAGLGTSKQMRCRAWASPCRQNGQFCGNVSFQSLPSGALQCWICSRRLRTIVFHSLCQCSQILRCWQPTRCASLGRGGGCCTLHFRISIPRRITVMTC